MNTMSTTALFVQRVELLVGNEREVTHGFDDDNLFFVDSIEYRTEVFMHPNGVRDITVHGPKGYIVVPAALVMTDAEFRYWLEHYFK